MVEPYEHSIHLYIMYKHIYLFIYIYRLPRTFMFIPYVSMILDVLGSK